MIKLTRFVKTLWNLNIRSLFAKALDCPLQPPPNCNNSEYLT